MNSESERSGSGDRKLLTANPPPEHERPLPLRRDMIERARALLADPDYPGIEVARALARTVMPVLE